MKRWLWNIHYFYMFPGKSDEGISEEGKEHNCLEQKGKRNSSKILHLSSNVRLYLFFFFQKYFAVEENIARLAHATKLADIVLHWLIWQLLLD